MGKVKRKIIKITDDRDRKTTFKKRLDGLMKKIFEIGVLCDQETFFFIRDHVTQRIRMFSSCDEEFIPAYNLILPEDRKGPRDVQHHYQKKQTKTSDSRTAVTDPPKIDKNLAVPPCTVEAPRTFSYPLYNTLMDQLSISRQALWALRAESQHMLGENRCLRTASH